jgi:hypothetical protein
LAIAFGVCADFVSIAVCLAKWKRVFLNQPLQVDCNRWYSKPTFCVFIQSIFVEIEHVHFGIGYSDMPISYIGCFSFKGLFQLDQFSVIAIRWLNQKTEWR